MSVGGVRGGGKGGKAGGAKGPSGAGGAKAAGGSTFGKVDRSESLVGVSGLVGSGNVGVQGSEPVLTAQALAIAQQLKRGELGSRGEATKKLVAEVLKEKLRMQSKALTEKIADALQDDPRLNQALERLWSKG
jgi:hypothetical protein